MGVVFAVLTILALAIKAFDRVDSLIPESGSTSATAPAPAAAPADTTEPQSNVEPDNARAAAAIAVALALAEAETRPPSLSGQASSGGLATASTRTWVAAGRNREMSNRTASQPMRARTGR